MIITVKKKTSEEELKKIQNELEGYGLSLTISKGDEYTVFGCIGDTSMIDPKRLEANIHVERVTRIAAPYKKVNRLFHPEDTVIDVQGVKIGGQEDIVIIGGPCAVENSEIFNEIADGVKVAGGKMLRGGAYKPRTSPYAFQGMKTQGIEIMHDAGKRLGMPIVSELMDASVIDEFVKHVDIIQIGARNMQNFELLKAVGKINKPILLKRGMANTIEEWLMAAEYIMAGGNSQVILCERGIRTFEKYTRNTLDLSVIAIVKQKTHLPIVIDPSHATGDWKLVESMSLAAIAAGCDGLIIEVHTNPECAMSDGSQSLKLDNFSTLIEKGKKIAEVIGRGI